jgi:hypothetical protein
MSGLGTAPAIEQVESISLAEEFPFLGAKTADDQAWRVRLAVGKLPWPKKLPGDPDAYPRRCLVYLDAGAERILAITARAEEPSAVPAPAALPAKPERSLLSRVSACLGPFSTVSPKLTFMEALAQACGGGSYPPSARDIDAYHLQYVAPGGPERSVWLVDLHGLPGEGVMSIPVLTVTPKPRPMRQRFHHSSTMIDAATGEFLYPMTQDNPDPRFPDQE